MIKECHTCITIPIKNPDERFLQCVEAIAKQDYRFGVSLLIINSGHECRILDHAIGLYKDALDILVENIDPSTFQHGRTRNLACRFFKAAYYVFLTQDAVPQGSDWLHELVLPLQVDSTIVGSYSRHVAHAEHSLFCHAELDSFFKEISGYPVVDQEMINGAQTQYEVDLMTFFSNNSSCIRGSYFRTCAGFPQVDFAEDQAWSVQTLLRGYKKAFSCNSVISHSHSLSIRESFGRGLDEAMSFRHNHNRRIMGINPVNIIKSALAWCYRDLNSTKKLSRKKQALRLAELPMQFSKRFSQSMGTYVGSSSRLSKLSRAWSRDQSLKNGNG